ncbi:hypothetical protein CMI47_17980 [Candidatus Pacearchaeota archaeon]|nr:hypothetical protein [Candidatus Pacearchaeota archaeon]|tara:strand:- start:2000 stop:3085 length:1086 start_codon:yes stop_codon:yes gene_type:complete
MSGYDFLGPFTPDEGVFDDEGMGPYGMPGYDPDEDFEDDYGPVAGPNYLLGSGLSIDDESQDYLDDDVPWGSGVNLSSHYPGYDENLLDDDDDDGYDDLDDEGEDDYDFLGDDDEDQDGYSQWFTAENFGLHAEDHFGALSMPKIISDGGDMRKYLYYLVDNLQSRLLQAGYPRMSKHPKIVALPKEIKGIDIPWKVEDLTEQGATDIAVAFRPIFLKAMQAAGMSHEWRNRYLNTMGKAGRDRKGYPGPKIPKKQVSASSQEVEALVTTAIEPEKASGKTLEKEPTGRRKPLPRKPPKAPPVKPDYSRMTETRVVTPGGEETVTTTTVSSAGFAFPGGGAGMALGLAGVALIGLGLWGRQ